MSVPFWLEDPFILFKQSDITEILPVPGMSQNRKLNAVMRAVILLTVIGYAISRRYQILVSGVIAAVMSVFVWRWGTRAGEKGDILKEGLAMRDRIKADHVLPPPDFTKPTKENPMMNVLVPEVQFNPQRLSAEPSYDPKVEKDINEKTQDFVVEQFNDDPKIRELLFGDMVESVVFDQSMRNFYSNPATTIPNDQGAFAQFCYGDQISCKQNNGLACERDAYRKYPTV
jgi:hypothetical protein